MTIYKPTDSEMTSFCKGMINMYKYGNDLGPDLMVFPLRGAYPFYACYRRMSEIEGKDMPKSELPPLGTCIDMGQKMRRGLTKPEKYQMINSTFDEFFKEGNGEKTILLVDEVFNGGTILTHHHMMNRYLYEFQPGSKLNVCAIEDSSHEQRSKYRNRANKFGYHTVRVASLFPMDREQFLPTVRKNSDFSVEIEDDKMGEILENLDRIYQWE